MSTEDLKTCSKCKEEKPRSEFYRDKSKKDGLFCRCKGCQKQHYKENAEKILQRSKQHYKENAEKIKGQRKQYYKENIEKIKGQGKQYYRENTEKVKQRGKQYRKENAERIKQYNKKYRENLPAAVYKIQNTKTGQTYIGQTTAYRRRWHEHKYALRRNKHGNPKLQEDCNKYGLDAFEFEIIKEFPPDAPSDILLQEEERIISEHLDRGENLYNERLTNA